MNIDLFGNTIENNPLLRDKFIEPPFSILDTKSGNWQRRKKLWRKLGIKSELGRFTKGSSSYDSLNRKKYSESVSKIASVGKTASIFDPALCEIIYHWFCPKGGDILQFGCGVGVTIEKLCELYGDKRVYGYDIFNPLNHTRIFSFDVYEQEPYKRNIAYCDIDIGSVATDKNVRCDLFDYAWNYLVKGGYILINNSIVEEFKKPHSIAEIKKLNEFDNKELWKNPHQNKLNTKTLVKKL